MLLEELFALRKVGKVEMEQLQTKLDCMTELLLTLKNY